MAAGLQLACVLDQCHIINRNHCMFGGYIMRATLEAKICVFATLRAGGLRLMFHLQRCAIYNVLSSKYSIYSNWIVNSLLIVSCNPLITVVRLIFSLSLVNI